jgi:alanine-glyoxylate transaminase/serine-glyoxylate transaminase/serine-pyruvate transaminase
MRLNNYMANSGPLIGYTSTGHGAWEATVTNLFDTGARILLCDSGHVSHRWGEMCEAHGLDVRWFETGWQRGVDPDALRDVLATDAGRDVEGILVAHTEASTGVTSDFEAIRTVLDDLEQSALLVVDSIASFGCTPLEVDALGVDACLAVSQKGLMMPIGLEFTGISDRAIAAAYANERGRFYWDLRRRLEAESYRMFCGTPPIQHLFGLDEALSMIAEEGGIDAVTSRHRRLADAVRAAVEVWSEAGALKFNATKANERSDSVTCVRLAENCDADQVVAVARQQFNLSMGSGIGPLAGSAFRIGDLNVPMLLGALGAVEASLRACQVPIGTGGLEAATKMLSEVSS